MRTPQRGVGDVDGVVVNAVTNPQPFISSRSLGRIAMYTLAVMLTLWILLPIYLITVASFSTRQAVYNWPKDFFPNPISLDTLQFFLNSHGVLDSAR
ncbi:MAG TPA: hypothetical protein VEW94_13495, partial [Chloroflexia bacterium]|nr:hypothetical protein [Chloroflexia bacterium]